MKFGIAVMPQHPRNDSSTLRFRQCVEQTILARDAGFDAIASGHHYLSPPYQSLQMENYKQLKVIELMGEHVLPYFHKKYGRA
jgi:hypothetical protein